MKWTALSLLFVLVGCMTNQEYVDAIESSPRSYAEIEWVEIKPETVITGRTYYFDLSETQYSLDGAAVDKVKEAVRKKMTELGYEEVKTLRKSYVSIYFVSDWKVLTDDDATTVKTTVTKMEKGKVVSKTTTDAKKLARFTLAFFVNDHAKRPIEVSRLTYTAPSENWKGYEEDILFSINRDFHGVMKKAPAANQQMAGDPGCLPRFGYLTDRMTNKVTSVFKNSPIERAGIKVGDEILAIDSMPLTETADVREMYEKSLKVPVKFKRGDKIMRSELKSVVMCE